MAVEIELKAHLIDFELIKKRLSGIGNHHRSYIKSDSYWLSRYSVVSGIRVRREKGVDKAGNAYESVFVTFKNKTISDGIEINEEREFTVSDAILFEQMLEELGMYKYMEKEKNGWAWDIPPQIAGQPPICAEISLVKSLGWFLELEIITEDHTGDTVEESRKRLLALLETLEIPQEYIEEKPYAQMLSEIETVDETGG